MTNVTTEHGRIADQIGSVQGTVFNIQGFSIHDGPGVRTTVFLKGCPLRCKWCQNPESLSSKPQLMVRLDRCEGCGRCAAACPNGAIRVEGGKAITDRKRCTGCGMCESVCPLELREITGKIMTAGEVAKRVIKDKLFFENSGGGMTVSGGECLMQPKFTAAILQLCQEAGIHTAIETSGFCNWERESEVLAHVDLVIHDIKLMNSGLHKYYTGVPNDTILENLTRISQELAKPILIRMPLIPGVNDSDENLRSMGLFVREMLPTCLFVQLLPYHRMGESKSDQLELTDIFSTSIPTQEKVDHCLAVLRSCGIEART